MIPGVAIATALMPPLCTAGFGLATGNLSYFFCALYLYFINTVFIGVATYFVVRFLKFSRKEFIDKHREKTVKRYIAIIAFCSIVPSVYITYQIFNESVFDDRVRRFISAELNFPNTQILNRVITHTHEKKEIKVVFIGETITDVSIAIAQSKPPD